jgi:hypothetical protein
MNFSLYLRYFKPLKNTLVFFFIFKTFSLGSFYSTNHCQVTIKKKLHEKKPNIGKQFPNRIISCALACLCMHTHTHTHAHTHTHTHTHTHAHTHIHTHTFRHTHTVLAFWVMSHSLSVSLSFSHPQTSHSVSPSLPPFSPSFHLFSFSSIETNHRSEDIETLSSFTLSAFGWTVLGQTFWCIKIEEWFERAHLVWRFLNGEDWQQDSLNSDIFYANIINIMLQ